MKKFKKFVASALAAVMVLGLAACGGGGGTSETQAGSGGTAETETTANEILTQETAAAADTSDGTAVDSGAAKESAKDSIIMGYTAEPNNINPGADSKTNAQMVVAMFHDGLVGKAPEDQSVIVPSISDTWEFSEDGTELTMHIRDDIKFHDGTPLTVEDVLFSLDYAVSQGLNASSASVLKSWEDVGDNNIKITLSYPYKPVLQILATPGYSIISKAFYEQCEADGTNFGMVENGTGAYTLESWTTGDRMVLKAYDDWHRGAPAIKDVEIRVCSDETSGALMVENGEIDFFIGMNNADRDRLAANENLELVDAYSAGTYIICMNLQEGPFADNLALREAVAYAINREEILLGGMNGVGSVTPGPITPGYFGYVEDFEPYPYDPEKAKEKMIEAGYPDGIDIEFKVASDSWYSLPAQVIVEQLRQVGIRCDLQIMERAPFLEETQEQLDYEMCYYITWGDFPDADPVMWGKFHSECIRQPMMNFGGVNDPEVDELLLKARTSLDDQERLDLYAELAEMNKENVWYLMVLTTYNAVVINKDIEGVTPIPAGYYNPAFYYWVEA